MLKTKTYDAETLKVELDIDNGTTCFYISLYGFSDTVQKLMKTICDSIPKLFENDAKAEGLFDIDIESMIQDYDNLLLESSDEVANDYFKRIAVGKNNTTVEQDL